MRRSRRQRVQPEPEQAAAANSRRTGQVQAKLVVGAVHDPAEQEADRMAEAVLQRLRQAPGEHDGGETRAPGAVSRSHSTEPSKATVGPDGGPVAPTLAAEIDARRSGGRPLEPGVRQRMEPAFAADLGGVRVHTGQEADGLSRALGATAFTTGRDIFFREGTYRPGSATGDRLLAHELTHVVQQGGALQRQRLQRKIGLEFEFEQWQTVQVSKGQFPTESSFPPTDKAKWRRIPKGKALVRGAGFELQADDDPNNTKRSDLEVVTDPFEESPGGRGQLRTAMQEVQATLQHIGNNFDNWALNGHHFPRATDLRGNAKLPYSFLYPHRPDFVTKPQTTIGLKLDKVADLLEDLFAAPNETVNEAALRAPGRKEMTGWDTAVHGAGPILTVQGEAPSQARTALANYVAATAGAPPASAEMTGLLSLVIAYLRMADQSLVTSYAKTIAPVMARTDFAQLFRMLSKPEQTWYKAHKGQPFFDLVSHAPWLTTMQPADEVFSQGVQAAKLGAGQAQGLSRGKWLKGIATGTDYLTKKKFPDSGQREDMQGLGQYGKKTDKVETAPGQFAKTAILELRAMPKTELADLADVADRIFVYTYLANRGGTEKYNEIQI